MAFQKVRIPNQLFERFQFFTGGDPDVTGTMDESATFVGAFELTEIRCAFSAAVSADIVLRAYVSSVQGVSQRYMFLSYALNNSQHYRWVASTAPMVCQSGDQLLFSHLTDNTYSLLIGGWAVQGYCP